MVYLDHSLFAVGPRPQTNHPIANLSFIEQLFIDNFIIRAFTQLWIVWIKLFSSGRSYGPKHFFGPGLIRCH